MPITALDAKTALIVVDLQKGLSAYPTAQPLTDVAARAGVLAAAFRARGLPVVLVNVAGGAPGRTEQSRPRPAPGPDFLEFLSPLAQAPSDLVVTKKTWGAFKDTGLDERLRGLGITGVVIAGVSTSIGVESTARQAFESGYNVALAIDAMTDTDADAHANSIGRIFPRLGETGDVEEILARLAAAAA